MDRTLTSHKLRPCVTEPPRSSPDCFGPMFPSLSVFLRTVLVSQAPFRFATMTSPVVAHDACGHGIFPHARQLSKRTSCSSPLPTRFLLRPTTLVLLLSPISVAHTPFCCRDRLRTLSTRIWSHVSPIPLRIILIIDCTDCIALRTIPLLFELPTRLFSMTILDPLFVALRVCFRTRSNSSALARCLTSR